MPVDDFTPTVADVGAILRARTRTAAGSLAGTFNPEAAAEGEQTTPTAEQVESLIEDVISDVQAEFGTDIPDAPVDEHNDDPDLYRKAVRRLAALGTALQVELTYWPEQVATGRSPYAQLKTLYDERRKRLLGILFPGAEDGGGTVSGALDASGGGFPTTAIGMEFPW